MPWLRRWPDARPTSCQQCADFVIQQYIPVIEIPIETMCERVASSPGVYPGMHPQTEKGVEPGPREAEL